MWRKPDEAKPSPQSSGVTAPTSIKSQSVSQVPATSAPPQAASITARPASDVSSPVSGTASRITSGLKIHGDCSGSSDLYIDGEVQGKIRLANSRVTVGPNGRVQAEIDAREIVVDGSVQGNLKAGESTRLGSSSRVVGSVLSPRIAIDDGARLHGKVETVPVRSSPEPAAVSPARDSEELPVVTASVKGE